MFIIHIIANTYSDIKSCTSQTTINFITGYGAVESRGYMITYLATDISTIYYSLAGHSDVSCISRGFP